MENVEKNFYWLWYQLIRAAKAGLSDVKDMSLRLACEDVFKNGPAYTSFIIERDNEQSQSIANSLKEHLETEFKDLELYGAGVALKYSDGFKTLMEIAEDRNMINQLELDQALSEEDLGIILECIVEKANKVGTNASQDVAIYHGPPEDRVYLPSNFKPVLP